MFRVLLYGGKKANLCSFLFLILGFIQKLILSLFYFFLLQICICQYIIIKYLHTSLTGSEERESNKPKKRRDDEDRGDKEARKSPKEARKSPKEHRERKEARKATPLATPLPTPIAVDAAKTPAKRGRKPKVKVLPPLPVGQGPFIY